MADTTPSQGVMAQNEHYDEEYDVDNLDIKFEDKASFREQSAAFQKVLHESSKYRKNKSLPEPQGHKPGTLEELSSRPLPECSEEGENDPMPTPRKGPPKPQARPLDRAKAGQGIYEHNAEVPNQESHVGPRVVNSDDVSDMLGTPRINKQPPSRTISLPPVTGSDKKKMDDIILSSRQPEDIPSRLKLANLESRSAPNSPRSPRPGGPMSTRRNKDFDNRISMNTQALASPRGTQQRLTPLEK